MAEKQRTIKFSEYREVKDHDGKVIEKFKAQETYTLCESSALRWINRGLAEEVTAGKAQKSAASEATNASTNKASSSGAGSADKPKPGSGR